MSPASNESSLHLEDRRELKLHGQALLEALLEFDRVHNGWLWRATEHSLSISPGATPPVAVEARRSDGNEVARAEFSTGHVAATFIHLCRTFKIPMPRNARKEVQFAEDGATLILQLSVPMPLRHSHTFVMAPAAAKLKAAAGDASAADNAVSEPAASEAQASDAATGDPGDEADAPAPVAAAG